MKISKNYETTQNNNNELAKFGKNLFKKILEYTSNDQDFNKVSLECERKKIAFQDQVFPPNENSLAKGYPKNSKTKKFARVTWQPLKEISSSPELFLNGDFNINPKTIKQGALSNCYFLSAVASLCEIPNRIKKLFISDKINSTSQVVGVRLCKDGEWKEILVDNYLPCDNRKKVPCFSTSSNENEMWVSYLEKCYAKAYGSYYMIEEGSIEEAFYDLTGCPCLTIENSNNDLWDILTKSFDQKFIITASAGETQASKELLKEVGLIQNHSYTVLEVYDVVIDDQNLEYLLKIRNPWGNTEWIGDWSDHSNLWTEDIKMKLRYQNKDDGSFWMNLKDFKHYFSKIQICKVFPNYKFNSKKLYQANGGYNLLKMKLEYETTVYLSLIQLSKKNFLNTNENYKYSIARFILSEVSNDSENPYNYVFGKMGQERVVTDKIVLLPGEYILFIEVDWVQKDYSFVFSSYSDEEIVTTVLKKQDYPDIIQKIYKSCAKKQNKVQNFTSDGAPNCFKYSGLTPEGYTYIYLENKEEDSTLLNDVKYTQFDGLTLLPPYSGTSYSLEVGPGEDKIVLIKQIDLTGFNLISSTHSNFQYGHKSLLYLTKTRGKKSIRKDPKLNIDVDIFVYTYKHSLGLCFYYENQTTDRTLDETLKITATGVEIMNSDLNEDNQVNILLGPGENKLIELSAKKNNWSVQSSVFYKIESNS